MKWLLSLLLLVISIFVGEPALSKDYSCSTILNVKTDPSSLPVIRLGFLPMQSRLIGGMGSEDRLWTISQLGTSENGELVWARGVSTFNAVRLFEFPLPSEVVEKAQKQQTTQNLAQPFLTFVYDVFKKELVKREVFTQDFIESLKAEDEARLEENFTVWAVFKYGHVVATWGLYKHTDGKFAGKYEIIRTASKGHRIYPLSNMLPLVSEYFNSILVSSGEVIVRTDKIGARKFKRLGAVQTGSYDSGKKFTLEMPIETFIQKFPSPDIKYGNQPLQLVRFLDENFVY